MVKIGFATGGHSDANGIVDVKVAVRITEPFCLEIFLVCESRANRALAQAHPLLVPPYIYTYVAPWP